MMNNDIKNRLRGKYAVGPIMEDGEPEFGYRSFGEPPLIQCEAADYIGILETMIQQMEDEQ